MASERTRVLLQWCSGQGLRIDPRLRVVDDGRTGIRVVATDDIPFPTVLVHIPKSAVLSVRSCAFSDLLADLYAPYGQGAQLALALALYLEILQGPRSKWAGYLDSLPAEPLELALFWGEEDEMFEALAPAARTSGDIRDAYRGSLPAERSRTRNVDREDADHAGGSQETREAAIEDGQEAQRWIRGTQIENELRGNDQGDLPLLEAVRRFYCSTAAPLLARPGLRARLSADRPPPRLGAFYHAYAFVSSRAFLVDAYHGLAMVPIADAFNHANENHVQMQSEYDVCAECGSLEECTHDAEGAIAQGHSWTSHTTSPGLAPEQKAALADPQSENANACEMAMIAPICAGEEVFNTYGAGLSNAQLLARYGFMLDGNEHDFVSWEPGELWRKMERQGTGDLDRDLERAAAEAAAVTRPGNIAPAACIGNPGTADDVLAVLGRMLSKWPAFAGWDASELVHNPRPGVGRDGAQHCNRGPILCVNADARVSHDLWMLAAVAAVGTRGGSGGWAHAGGEDALLGELQRAAARLLALEGTEASVAGDDYGEAQIVPDSGYITDAPRALGGGGTSPSGSPSLDMPLARTICSWCVARRGRIGPISASSAELGQRLDALPTTMKRTRLAMTGALVEISLLEACEAAWRETL